MWESKFDFETGVDFPSALLLSERVRGGKSRNFNDYAY